MFNTLLYTKKLEQVGISREQAEMHVQIMAEILEGNLATKQDMQETKQEIRDAVQDTQKEIQSIKRDFFHQLEQVESRLVIRLGMIMGGMFTISLAIIAMMVRN